MALPPRDHHISLEAAAALTRRYRDVAGKAAQKAGAFHADQVGELLAQPGCVALRIYYGKDESGENTLVLVGVDGNDKDMTGGVLLDFIFPCPPVCTEDSPLNS
jgi:hypothetical protein